MANGFLLWSLRFLGGGWVSKNPNIVRIFKSVGAHFTFVFTITVLDFKSKVTAQCGTMNYLRELPGSGGNP